MSGGYRMVARAAGGPDAIVREAIAPQEPRPGAVRVAIAAAGVNFIDTYHRSGLYPLPAPISLGVEAAGAVEAVGEGVNPSLIGRKVAVLTQTPGCYATHVVVPAARIVPLPAGVEPEVGAAVMLKGLTAWMLAEPCAHVEAGDAVLVHAAAGGVGSLLVPWLKSRGATVIAHAGTAEKAARAAAAGADVALACPLDALAAAVRDATGGRGVRVAFDGVGEASWAASIGALGRRGLLVSYGNASGPAPAVAPLDLMRAGSLFLTRPTLWDYLDDLPVAAARLFAQLAAGVIRPEIGRVLPLTGAAEAHRALEARQTTGATILLP